MRANTGMTRIYTGEWVHGKMKGRGIMVSADGKGYDGHFLGFSSAGNDLSILKT